MECLEWINDELKQVHDNKLFRYLTELQTGQSPEVTIGGKKYILLASNSYLGLSVDPRVIQAAGEALEKYGTGSGGFRLVSGSSDLHRRLEEKIASFKNTESAILFSSGYLANIGTISSMVGPDDFVYSDELNHASIIDGCRLSRARVITGWRIRYWRNSNSCTWFVLRHIPCIWESITWSIDSEPTNCFGARISPAQKAVPR